MPVDEIKQEIQERRKLDKVIFGSVDQERAGCRKVRYEILFSGTAVVAFDDFRDLAGWVKYQSYALPSELVITR